MILGENGSGKSTLLKIISSFITPSSGRVSYFQKEGEVILEDVSSHISICSPSLELEGSFSLEEMYDFHFSLRQIKKGFSKKDFFTWCILSDSKDKKVKELSSGMTQRLKLGFAFFTHSDLILLDEPCMNLDKRGLDMYAKFNSELGKNITQIIASNSIAVEYEHCNSEIKL